MATLDTTDDLLRAARENREFREAFRREILTDDLIALPQRVGEYQRGTNEQITLLTDNVSALTNSTAEFQKTTDARLAALQSATEALLSVTTGIQTSIVRFENMLSEQEQAQSSFRGTYAQSTASEEDVEIARKFAAAHGLDSVLIDTIHIGRRTLREWANTHRDVLLTLDLKQSNPLDKFIRPDIVAAITDATDEDATPVYYLAVEASYSGEKKDIDKATDNAKILRAITGLKAYPVVAAVRLHHRMDDETRNRLYEDVNDFIEADNPDSAFWYKIDSDDMRPPEPR